MQLDERKIRYIAQQESKRASQSASSAVANIINGSTTAGSANEAAHAKQADKATEAAHAAAADKALEADHATAADLAYDADHAAAADLAYDADHSDNAAEADHAASAAALDDDLNADLEDKFLRKDQDDESTHTVTVAKLKSKGDVEASGDVTARGKIIADNSVTTAGSVHAQDGIHVGTDDAWVIDYERNAYFAGVIAGYLHSENFKAGTASGFDGTGYGITGDAKGRYTLEIDDIISRGRVILSSMEVHHATFVGGMLVMGPCGNRFDYVEALDDDVIATSSLVSPALTIPDGDTPSVFRCYFRATDGDGAISNDWSVGQLARCKTNNITAPGHYTNFRNRDYWRLVVGVSTEPVDIGGVPHHYIDLSNSTAARIALTPPDNITRFVTIGGVSTVYNSLPQAGDSIVGMGHAWDTKRQGVAILDVSAMGWIAYKGIDSYELPDSKIVSKFTTSETRIATDMLRLVPYAAPTEETPVLIYRGTYSEATAYGYGDVVTYQGQLWRCTIKAPDTVQWETPSANSAHWELYVDKGNDGVKGEDAKVYSIRFDANGTPVTSINLDTYLNSGTDLVLIANFLLNGEPFIADSAVFDFLDATGAVIYGYSSALTSETDYTIDGGNVMSSASLGDAISYGDDGSVLLATDSDVVDDNGVIITGDTGIDYQLIAGAAALYPDGAKAIRVTFSRNGVKLCEDTLTLVFNGKQGEKGDKGEKGDTGAQGEKGENGDSAVTYRLVPVTRSANVALNTDGDYTLALTLIYQAKKIVGSVESQAVISGITSTIAGAAYTTATLNDDKTQITQTYTGGSYSATNKPQETVSVTVTLANGVTLADSVPVTLSAGAALTIDSRLGVVELNASTNAGDISTIKQIGKEISAKVTNISDDLLATGVDIVNRKTTFTNDNFVIQNNSGTTTFTIDSDGNIVGSGSAAFKGSITGSSISSSAISGGTIYGTTITGGTISGTTIISTSSNETSKTTISGGQLVTNNADIEGVLRLKCATSGSYSSANLFFLEAFEFGVNVFTFQNDVNQVGKVIRFFNSSAFGGGAYIIRLHSFTVSVSADGDFTCTNVGEFYDVVLRPQECVEITCFSAETTTNTDGSTVTSCYWEITSRFSQDDFIYRYESRGRFPRCLAMGKTHYSKDSSGNDVVTISGKFWNGNSLSNIITVKRTGEGVYVLTYDSLLIPDDSFIMLTGVGRGYGWTDCAALKATLISQGSGTCTVCTSDDTSNNDGDFNIMIFGPNWEYNML